jgi:biopolymer transport protein ExbD
MASAGQGPLAGDGGGCFADINVTPLVDITLVLLIIFMVAAPLIVSSPSIKVDLPKAATADETQRSPIALTLQPDATKGYRLFANGKETDETKARTLIAGLVGHDPQVQAIIAADKRIAYGDVMHVVDLVKSLGVAKFALDTEAGP